MLTTKVSFEEEGSVDTQKSEAETGGSVDWWTRPPWHECGCSLLSGSMLQRRERSLFRGIRRLQRGLPGVLLSEVESKGSQQARPSASHQHDRTPGHGTCSVRPAWQPVPGEAEGSVPLTRVWRCFVSTLSGRVELSLSNLEGVLWCRESVLDTLDPHVLPTHTPAVTHHF